MGEVWKAFDTATQRVVAVNVLPPQLAADPVFEQRFRREAYAAAGLNEPHVVPIHNFGEIEGRLYVDMRPRPPGQHPRRPLRQRNRPKTSRPPRRPQGRGYQNRSTRRQLPRGRVSLNMSRRPRHPPEPARRIMSRRLGRKQELVRPRLLTHPRPPADTTRDKSPAAGAPQRPSWQRKGVVIPIAAIVMIAAVGGTLIAVGGDEPPPRGSGPLDGTYAVEFASATRPNGQPDDNAPSGRETWVITSACPASGCVATATKVDGSQSAASTMVLDEIDGRWTAERLGRRLYPGRLDILPTHR